MSLGDYINMYQNCKSIQGEKISGSINYFKGSVIIENKKVNIDWNSYTKREKIYNPETNLWIETRPLYIDTLTRSITIWKPKEIIIYEKKLLDIIKIN